MLLSQREQDRKTGIWFFNIIFKYGFLIWLFTYGEPDLLAALINFLNSF